METTKWIGAHGGWGGINVVKLKIASRGSRRFCLVLVTGTFQMAVTPSGAISYTHEGHGVYYMATPLSLLPTAARL